MRLRMADDAMAISYQSYPVFFLGVVGKEVNG